MNTNRNYLSWLLLKIQVANSNMSTKKFNLCPVALILRNLSADLTLLEATQSKVLNI